jgi:hypothetical protein
MIAFLKNLFRKKVVLPYPDRYPDPNRVDAWMEEKAHYFEVMQPELLHTLFDPSCGDYLPRAVHVATSLANFRDNHLEKYREIRSRYPEHVCKKDPSSYWIFYPDGPAEDYPR